MSLGSVQWLDLGNHRNVPAYFSSRMGWESTPESLGSSWYQWAKNQLTAYTMLCMMLSRAAPQVAAQPKPCLKHTVV